MSDPNLQEETADECARFGPVLQCIVCEADRDNEGVRIFVEFRNDESAVRTVKEMDGRYFDSREVRASLYSESRFKARDFT